MATLAPPESAAKYLAIHELNSQNSLTIPFYKELIYKADQKSLEDFYNKIDIELLVYTRCWYIEELIVNIWNKHDICTHSLVAVGGFGRGELHPHSDIDLLILSNNSSKNSLEQISNYIQFLWDIGLYIGHSVRSPNDCYIDAKADVTIATNLMESRLLVGNNKQYQKMKTLVSANSIWNGVDFFKAKWKEQIARHHKFGGTAYNLEPNLKEGPGGLRDIQMISWVTQRHFQKNTLKDLVHSNFLTQEEYNNLNSGLKFLWRVRFALHILSNRKEERLLFDLQAKLAGIFGYQSKTQDNLAVEQFMQKYYKKVMNLERLNNRLLQLFDESILQKDNLNQKQELNESFHLINNYIEIKDPNLFNQKPTVWFELFILLQENTFIKGIRANTSRAIRENINVINNSFRKNRHVQAQFIDLFRFEKDLPKTLNRLNRLGILAKYLPPFGNIVGRMQFDLFHVYTVDQHSLFVVKNLYKMRTHKSNIKKAHIVFDQVKNPYVVYFAGLFHDIAKGRGGSHSELGAQDALEFCELHGISDEKTQLITWLVKDHLIMSVTAQKKDINDPKVISDFCKKVDSLEKLRCLYLLTIADISATDPKLWNGFKESLMNELYHHAQNHINKTKISSINDIKQKLIDPNEPESINKKTMNRFIKNLPDSIYQTFNIDKLKRISSIACKQSPPIVEIINSNNRSHEFLFYTEDFIGLFYCIASIFEKYNLNIVDAKINNTDNNYALNTIHCISTESEINETQLVEELRTTLESKRIVDFNFSKHQSIREKQFNIKPKFYLQESNSDNRTKIEVICKDRPGLLAIISKILLQSNITINAAKIATFGTRAEDGFWISYENNALSETQTNNIKQQLLEKL